MKAFQSAKVLYGLSGAAVVLCAGGLFIFNNSLGDLRTKVASNRAQAEQEKDAQSKLLQAQRDLTGLKAHLAHLEQGIPDAAYVPTMLKELEALGKTQGVDISGLRPNLDAKPASALQEKTDALTAGAKPYEPLDLELKGHATYGNFLKFVSALNTFPKILEVRTVTITPGQSGPNQAKDELDITMGVRAFLFKQPGQQKKDGFAS